MVCPLWRDICGIADGARRHLHGTTGWYGHRLRRPVGDGHPLHRGGAPRTPLPEQVRDFRAVLHGGLPDGRGHDGRSALAAVLRAVGRGSRQWPARADPPLVCPANRIHLLRGPHLLPYRLASRHFHDDIRFLHGTTLQCHPGLWPLPNRQRYGEAPLPDGTSRRPGHHGDGRGHRGQGHQDCRELLALARLLHRRGFGTGLWRHLPLSPRHLRCPNGHGHPDFPHPIL